MTDSTAADQAEAQPEHGPLAGQLLAPSVFPRLNADAAALVVSEISKRGFAIRTPLAVVTRLKPDLVERGVRELMPAFVAELEPCYARWRESGESGQPSFEAHMTAHPETVADAMLAVADRRAQRIHSKTIRSTYRKVRGRAQREIVDAMPAIAATIARHLG